MDGRSDLILSVGPGGLGGVGPGIAGYTAWIVAFVAFAVMLGLAGLAWWTLRPAKRAARSQQRKAPSGTTAEKPHTERRDR